MKTWDTPTIDELNISCTEYGHSFSTNYDEVRVDQNGEYWVSFSSGATYEGPVDGEVEKKD